MSVQTFTIRRIAVAAAALLGSCLTAGAQDVAGSQDHPLVGRFRGATIVAYKAAGLDEAALLKAPHDYAALLDRNATKDRSGPEWLRLEGAVTRIRYEIPPGASSLQVMRAHVAALEAKGLSTRFSCVDAACLTGKLTDNYLLGEQIDAENGISTAYSDKARYTLLSGPAGGGTVHVALLVGESRSEVTGFVTIVETDGAAGRRGDAGSIEGIGRDLAERGRAEIPGILFDVDKDRIKPEFKSVLDQIAEVLAAKPAMRLEIVGHTDDTGGAEHNLDLSRRRAQAVVGALTSGYGVAPARLRSSGQGAAVPVAANDTDEGRARNRRVELIAR